MERLYCNGLWRERVVFISRAENGAMKVGIVFGTPLMYTLRTTRACTHPAAPNTSPASDFSRVYAAGAGDSGASSASATSGKAS